MKPSALDEVYWSHSHNDLKTIVSLTTQEKMANHFQTFESLKMVAIEALGGTVNESSSDTDAIQTFDELVQAFQAVGGTLG